MYFAVKAILIWLLCIGSANANGVLFLYSKSPAHFDYFAENEGYQITYIQDDIFHFENAWQITVDLEVSAHKWIDNSGRWSSFEDSWFDDIYGAAITPVFKMPLYENDDGWLVQVGLGIGISYQNDDNFGYAALGSRWLFEDKLQFNFIYQGRHQLTLFLQHYSNADLAGENQGADFYGVGYGYRWR